MAVQPLPMGAPPAGPQRLDACAATATRWQQDGRTIITEPGRVIIRDPSGMEFVRHDEMDRFRYGRAGHPGRADGQ